MNLNDEKIKDLKDEYMKIEIPAELDKRMRAGVIKGMKDVKKSNLLLRRAAAVCAAAACISVFALTVNVNPALADSMQDIPLLGSLLRLVTVDKIDIQNDKIQAQAEIPSVSGLSDSEYQNSLNNELEERVQGTIDDALKESEGKAEGQMPVIVDSGYVFKSSSDSVLSFGIVTTEVRASGHDEYSYYNIDLKNNFALSLSDLFEPGADYVSVINESIRQQIDEQMKNGEGVYFTAEDDAPTDSYFKSIDSNQSFFINQDGKLVITFDEYEIAPGSSGCPEFVIPTELLADHLNDGGYIK